MNVQNTLSNDRNVIISTISVKTFLKLKNDAYNITKKRVLHFVKESCNECCLQNGKIAIIPGCEDLFTKIIKEINEYGMQDGGSHTEWERFNPLMLLSIFMIARNDIITTNKSITRELLQCAIKRGYNDLMIDCRTKTYHKPSMLQAIELTPNVKNNIHPQILMELLKNNQTQIDLPNKNVNEYNNFHYVNHHTNPIEYQCDRVDEVEEISRKKRKHN